MRDAKSAVVGNPLLDYFEVEHYPHVLVLQIVAVKEKETRIVIGAQSHIYAFPRAAAQRP